MNTFVILYNRLSSTICNSFELLHLEKAERLLVHITGNVPCTTLHYSTAHSSNLTFVSLGSDFDVDIMNMLTFKLDTQVVYVSMKSSRTKLFPCMRSQNRTEAELAYPSTTPEFPSETDVLFFCFFHCITRAKPTQTLLLAAWFQASSNVELNSTPKALPTLLIFMGSDVESLMRRL